LQIGIGVGFPHRPDPPSGFCPFEQIGVVNICELATLVGQNSEGVLTDKGWLS
jgi:hypothetical protein